MIIYDRESGGEDMVVYYTSSMIILIDHHSFRRKVGFPALSSKLVKTALYSYGFQTRLLMMAL
jgi:hypothetical protein